MCQQYLFKTQGVTNTLKTGTNTVSIHQQQERRWKHFHTFIWCGFSECLDSSYKMWLTIRAAWQVRYVTCNRHKCGKDSQIS